MIILDKYNFDFIKVSVTGSREIFERHKKFLKTMPVRIYKSKRKIWILPVRDVNVLVKKMKRLKIEYSIKNTKRIIQNIRDFTIWKSEQLKAKRLYSEVEPDLDTLVFYQTEMDILKLKLRPFQSVGSYFAFNSTSSIICDPVGLGKSVQSLSCAEKRMIIKESNFNLIICPSTLKRNWSEEIIKFTDRTFIIVGGTKAKRKNIYKKSYAYDYMIVNYDVLYNDLDLINKFILDRDGLRVNLIIDEIQYVNNRTSKRSKAVRKISDKSNYVMGLSATLLENKITDLFNSFQVIDRTVFGDETQYFSFVQRFCKVNWFGDVQGYKNPKLIKRRIAPHFIRRLKDDVLTQLPKRIENNYWIELSAEQRKFYEDMKIKMLNKIKDMEKRHKIMMADILPMIIYLRQCVLSTMMVGHDKNISTKTIELLEIIRAINKDDKLVLFCHHPMMIELLAETMFKNKITYMAMHGNPKMDLYCKIDDRVEMVNKFNNSKIKILLTSDILREGVNIPSANYLINFDLLFNPAKVEQRIGRLDRLDTKHKVINIINIIASNTVEENVYEKFYTKRNMSKDILDDNKEEKRLTVKTIKSLFDL